MPKLNIKPFKNGDDASPANFNDRFQKVADLLNNGLDSSNLADNAVTAEKIQDGAITAEKIADEPDWLPVTYKNGWVDYDTTYGGAKYYKDALGLVHLQGLIKSGTTTSGTAFFTLPAGYRPGVRLIFPVTSNNAIARVDIQTNGDVTANAGVASNWVNLSNIVFRAEA